jgi:hypothetical protein
MVSTCAPCRAHNLLALRESWVQSPGKEWDIYVVANFSSIFVLQQRKADTQHWFCGVNCIRITNNLSVVYYKKLKGGVNVITPSHTNDFTTAIVNQFTGAIPKVVPEKLVFYGHELYDRSDSPWHFIIVWAQ